jgi:hypothetical protein
VCDACRCVLVDSRCARWRIFLLNAGQSLQQSPKAIRKWVIDRHEEFALNLCEARRDGIPCIHCRAGSCDGFYRLCCSDTFSSIAQKLVKLGVANMDVLRLGAVALLGLLAVRSVSQCHTESGASVICEADVKAPHAAQ